MALDFIKLLYTPKYNLKKKIVRMCCEALYKHNYPGVLYLPT